MPCCDLRRNGVSWLRDFWAVVTLPEDDWLNLLRCDMCLLSLWSQMSLSLWMLSSCMIITDVCICDVSSFCSRMLVHVSHHPLVLSRQVVTSVALRVLHWPWTTGSGTQPPTPQASSPKQAMQLLPWCTGSGSQTNVNLLWEADNLSQAIPGHQAIMFSRSSYLTFNFYNLEREGNRGLAWLFFHHFPSSCHIPRT